MGSRVTVPGSFNRCHQLENEDQNMFGLNRAEVIGRLGADVTINRVAESIYLLPFRPENTLLFNKL